MHVLTRQVHSEFADFLTSNPSLEEIAAFQLSDEAEARISHLLELNRTGQINRDEQQELDDYLHLEHLMRLTKIRAIAKLKQQ
jgi:hypothetical protein